MLTDSFGRPHRDLRISLTDRCNLRCRYCLPEAGVPWLPKRELLSTNEIVRIARIAAELGVTEVRLTGGEPLLRPDVVDVVAALAQIRPALEISMTTNAMRLATLAQPLRTAGLARFNISLDTLNRQTFAHLTRRDRLQNVLDGISAVSAAGFGGTKLNSVLLRGINDGEALSLLDWAGSHSFELRFIEQMPLDAGHTWSRTEMVTSDEVFAKIAEVHALTLIPGRGAAPAERFRVDGGPQVVGFISSVSRPFCGACDRLRLTADGQLRNCLFAGPETDLRAVIRGGGTDDDIAAGLRRSLTDKLPGHGINDPGFLQPKRPMSAIGG